MKKLLSAALAAALLVVCLAGCGSSGAGAPGLPNNPLFAGGNEGGAAAPAKTALGTTPEETVTIFLNALKDQDLETMLDCCYIDAYTEQVSFERFYKNSTVIIMNSQPIAPTEHEYYRDILRWERGAQAARQIRLLTYGLLATDERWEGFLGPDPKVGNGSFAAADFAKDVDPRGLTDLAVKRIDTVEIDPQINDRYQQTLLDNYGAANCVEQTALLELDGQLFLKGFTLTEVDGRWQILLLCARMTAGDLEGYPTPVASELEYLQMITDE